MKVMRKRVADFKNDKKRGGYKVGVEKRGSKG